tara:strand:+ start:1361 stop:2053 length:693 start_codon:yes stop_codon:yes gene_type:complete
MVQRRRSKKRSQRKRSLKKSRKRSPKRRQKGGFSTASGLIDEWLGNFDEDDIKKICNKAMEKTKATKELGGEEDPVEYIQNVERNLMIHTMTKSRIWKKVNNEPSKIKRSLLTAALLMGEAVTFAGSFLTALGVVFTTFKLQSRRDLKGTIGTLALFGIIIGFFKSKTSRNHYKSKKILQITADTWNKNYPDMKMTIAHIEGVALKDPDTLVIVKGIKAAHKKKLKKKRK